MSRFNEDELDEKIDRLKLQNELLEQEYTVAQRKAMIKEIRKKYGANWKSILGGLKDNESLRQLSGTRFKLI